MGRCGHLDFVKPGPAVLLWILRTALALGLIILILLLARHVAPPVTGWIGTQAHALRTVPAQQATYAEAARSFEVYAADRRSGLEQALASLTGSSQAELRARRERIGPALARQEAALLSPAALALAAARGDAGTILSHYRAGAEIELLRRERQQIDALLAATEAGGEGLSLENRRHAAIERQRASHLAWLAARGRVEQLQSRPLAAARDAVCRVNLLDIGCDNYRALVAARRAMNRAAAENRAARRDVAAIDRLRQGLTTAGAALIDAGAVLDERQAALAAQVDELEQTARANWLITAWRAVAEVLPAALLILALAYISPVLIKATLFFAVAPLAARRPPIRLMPTDRGEVRTLSPSAVSQQIRIEPGQELLVLPEAVQSTSHHAAKRTRWLLSWRIPLSSLASGMVGLTEIRVQQADTVLVSATGGPLSEIALVRLEAGSALVLRPRALRGLLQETATPLRITRRWRFGLSAWLTLQFRYLIFHGPCTFIVEGARGVRLEPAGAGRGINQAATLGFSAGLAYGVSRTETFGAYLFGRQALFNDSFQSADGAHLHEEMPLSRRRSGIWSGGLRGAGDAALKLVGL